MADTTMAPEWRQCKAFPDYEVSDTGLVRKGGSLRKLQFHPYGYTLVCITAKPKQLKAYVHRLVAEAFHGPGAPGTEVDHINGDKTDNRAANLRWLDRATNRRLKVGRNKGSVAQALQAAGKASSATLDVDARVIHGERRGIWRNLRKTKQRLATLAREQNVVAVEDIV